MAIKDVKRNEITHNLLFGEAKTPGEFARKLVARLSCSFIPDCRHNRVCVFPVRGRTSGRDAQGRPLEAVQ